MAHDRFSIYLSYLLRHHPEDLGLGMDSHGWVDVQQLLDALNRNGGRGVSFETLAQTVAADAKGRYRFNEDCSRIKACQGHTIPWVEPELRPGDPPQYLYHGTTAQAWAKIRESGSISRMRRHAVHMQADPAKAWQSARRWHQSAIVLQIDAQAMARRGFAFGEADNGVWCTEAVPLEFIAAALEQ